jgi:thioredoxin 1
MSNTELIDEPTSQNLRAFFGERLTDTVDVQLYCDDEASEGVDFTRRLITELAGLSERINLTELPLDDAARERGMVSPSLVIGAGLGYLIEMHGAPAGHEAGALVETLGLVGSGDSGLNPTSRELLAILDKDLLLRSFVSPTCPHCPGSVVQNHKIAVEAKGRVRSVAVSAPENMELAQRFNVSSVPQQVIGDDLDSVTVGIQPERDYVEQILSYGATGAEAALEAVREKEAEKTRLVDDPDFAVTVTDANFEQAVSKYPFLVVDCWAEWCGPCRMLAPIIEELAGEQKGRMVFGKLDTEANSRVPGEYEIRSIPTMLVFKNGELLERITGASPKAELLEKLNALIG